MNILYDGTPLLMRSAGVKNYHHALLSHLIPIIEPHRLQLFPLLRQLTPNDNERSNYGSLGTKLRLAGVLASNYSGVPLWSGLTRGADILHLTPFVQRPPEGVPLTSMVHDPTPVLLPECHPKTNIRYFEWFVERILPRLGAILTPSQAVKADLVKHFGVPAERITAVHHGVDEDFFDASPALVGLVRQTYDLPRNYVLFVGAMEPRKNLITLVDAYEKLSSAFRKRHPLVITGAAGWKNRTIKKRLEQVGAHLTGYVSRVHLPALYHAAQLFVFPSLYEGFGMPLLEAMAARVPVITSNVSAMPEVAGEAAVYVDPHDSGDLADAIERVLEQPELASALGEGGRRRARQFTWEATAAQTKAFFETVAAGL
ncbi:MAG: glycosyltransferase family 1 protein [Acidobacteria bacterium]|nr:glycosyltransferase family 1 protein [Acidobacteriota bacterium]